MIIALDGFGSDNAPQPEVEGAVFAVQEGICDKVLITGFPEELEKAFLRYEYDRSKIEIVPASQIVTMEDHASSSARSKKDSSLARAVQIHKDGLAGAAVSCGNTGAMMANSLFTMGRIPNVVRPAIAIALPTMKRPTIFLDAGANVDCLPEYLVQFAVMGSLYSKYIFQVDNPQVALLNIGEESVKGNELSKKAHQLLLQTPAVNFIGNIEGKYLLGGEVDVIVCDGFVGNIMLKTIEGVAMSIFRMLKEQIARDWIARLGAMLAFPAFKYMKKKMDHSEYGGALLVGINGYSVIAHGSSNAKAVKSAIRFGTTIGRSGFLEQARDYFSRS